MNAQIHFDSKTTMHQPPTPLEITVAKFQSDVEHIQSDVTELKTDVKQLIAHLASAKVWALLLYIAMGASLLGVMAKGFKWF